MDIRRVALIYDGIQRPETTGLYCRRALGRMIEVEHFQPDELARIPRTGFDLYLNVDDGLRYRLPPDLHPRAWWAIDTHLNFEWCLERARDFDLVFAAQRDGAERLRREGIESAAWLPLACDPEFHRKHGVAKRYDVAFVGNLFPGPRTELLGAVRARYADSFIGRRYFEEMARTYSEARTAFNRSLKDDINMRVFEALACGSLLLTNDLEANGQEELFRDGTHLATYRGAEDLLDKLAYYLKKEAIRERIAAAGLAEAHARHTYAHRMEHLLREAEAKLSRVTVAPALRIMGESIGDGPGQDVSYFEHARPEVLAMVPRSASRVLDLGCGAGRLGMSIKQRQPARVTGVELNTRAAELARDRLDEVIVGDVEDDLDFLQCSFDVIVCGDILEHLRNPDQLLRKARGWLTPDGRLIASIPNVRHHSVVRSLLAGNWTYESAGLLDRDHVRFFTRREIEKLFFRAGFEVEELGSVGGPEDGDPKRRKGEVTVGRLRIGGLSAREADEFYAYQYLLRGTPASDPDYGLTSIVILTHDQLDYTRTCLDSIQRLTDEPYELIVVDNASSDGTVEYLGTIPGLRLIRNDTNRGFPAAANQGIAAATGRQVLLLNNDTVATTGWLRRMLDCLHADPGIGLVGPCSNRVSGDQRIEVDYDSLADLDGFAWDWGRVHRGERIETDRLVGFCLLIRREVIDAIGALDEQFGTGCFEDDDYTLRSIRAGYRAVIARDSFVHHFGGRTFAASGVDFARLMGENQRRFRDKWPEGVTAPPHTSHPFGQGDEREIPSGYRLEVTPTGGLLLKPGRIRLSLCMIVRDSARTLPACLESIRHWVDEMVIVDTGSLDETPRIVESFGGRLFHFPWCDDFSAARNESLRHARGEWLFWMDSDDTIPPECGRGLRELVDGAIDPRVLGFVMQVHCPGNGETGDPHNDVTAVDHVKLFRNRPDLRFDGRIHEQILPAIRMAGGEVAWTDHYVVHSGSDPGQEAQARKRRRDLRILHLELRERPEHPFTLFNLGMTCVDGSDFEQGADYLRRGIARSGERDSHLRKAYALLVYAEMRLGHPERALEICRRGRALFPEDAELRFREGILLHDLGRLDEAARAYHDVLRNREERHFSSIDRGLTGFKARQNLAVVAADRGDLAEAERQWRLVTDEMPRYRPGWRGLAEILIRQGRMDDARAIAEDLLGDAALRIEGLLLKHRIAMTLGRLDDAKAELDRARMEDDDDPETLQGLCRFHFEHGRPEDAEGCLRRLIGRDPADASAHHNLGTLLLRAGRYEEAEQSYRQSLAHRRNHPETYVHLGHALRGRGRIPEARSAWEQALELDPGNASVRDELARLG